MEWLLKGLVENVDWGKVAKIAAGLFVAGVIAYKVKGAIDKKKLQEALSENGMTEAVVEAVNKKGRVVSMKDIKSGKKIDVAGEKISDEIYEGQHIYA